MRSRDEGLGGAPLPTWVLKLVLLAFPRDFRGRHGRDLIRLVLDEHAARPRSSMLRERLAILADLLGSAIGVRFDRLMASEEESHAGRVQGGIRNGKGGGGMMSSIGSDLRHAVRSLRRSPGFTATTVLILAVGIGATVSMFGVLDAALFGSLPYPDPDRLVMARTTFSGRINLASTFPDYVDYRDGSESFDGMASVYGSFQRPTVTGSDSPERTMANRVSVDFFEVLDVEPQLGRTFTRDEAEPDAPDVVVISHGFWQRWFGGAADVVGLPLTVDGVPRTVVGVMPAGFRFRYDIDLWLPVVLGTLDTEVRVSHSWHIIGRMGGGVTLEQAQAQVDVISARLAAAYPESHVNKGLLVTPLGEVLAEGYRPALLVLMGATALLLLIACVNVAGLLVSRATVRKTEISVRAALGASRRALARQLFVESLVLAILAGIGGSVLALWLQRMVLTFFPLDLLGVSEVAFSGPMLAFALLISLVTALLFGVGPSLAASRANPAEHLRGGRLTSSGGKGVRARGGLVVAQVALSVVLLTASGLLIRSFVRLHSVDIGFQTENMVTAGVSLAPAKYEDVASRARFYRGLLADVRAMPGVTAASMINMVPIRDRYTNWSVWDHDNPPAPGDGTRSAFARTVLPGYFDAMGIPMVRGRDHEDRDEANAMPYLVINEALASSLFPDQDPIGRQLTVLWTQRDAIHLEILGVVADSRITSLDREPDFQMYFSFPTGGWASMNLVVRTQGELGGLMPAIRQAVLDRDPDVPLSNVATMTDIISASISANRTLSLATAIFAITALLLSVMGLYAVLAYHVAQRTREIGIRMAFGANRAHVLNGVMGRGVALVGGGLVIGLVAAGAANRMLAAQLYEVGVMDPVTFGVVAAGFLIVGSLASLIPARRATRVDPIRAMQTE